MKKISSIGNQIKYLIYLLLKKHTKIGVTFDINQSLADINEKCKILN